MIRINLLPIRAERERETVRRQAVYAVIGLVAVLGVCVWSYLDINSDIATLEESNAALREDIERLKKVIGQVEEFKASKAELQQKIEVIEKLKRDRTGPVHLLDEIADAVPEKAWLTSLTQTGEKVNLVGQAINWESIADFTDGLRHSAHIAKVEVGPTKRVKQGELFVQEFLLTAVQREDVAKPEEAAKPDKKADAPAPAPAAPKEGGGE